METSEILKNNIELILLSQLAKKDSYAYEINKNIKELSQNILEFKEANLYTSFKRMESMGYIEAYWGDETRGARRRYYRLSTKGQEEINKQQAAWQKAVELMKILG